MCINSSLLAEDVLYKHEIYSSVFGTIYLIHALTSIIRLQNVSQRCNISRRLPNVLQTLWVFSWILSLHALTSITRLQNVLQRWTFPDVCKTSYKRFDPSNYSPTIFPYKPYPIHGRKLKRMKRPTHACNWGYLQGFYKKSILNHICFYYKPWTTCTFNEIPS